jgi:hypothetical protein
MNSLRETSRVVVLLLAAAAAVVADTVVLHGVARGTFTPMGTAERVCKQLHADLETATEREVPVLADCLRTERRSLIAEAD